MVRHLLLYWLLYRITESNTKFHQAACFLEITRCLEIFRFFFEKIFCCKRRPTILGNIAMFFEFLWKFLKNFNNFWKPYK